MYRVVYADFFPIHNPDFPLSSNRPRHLWAPSFKPCSWKRRKTLAKVFYKNMYISRFVDDLHFLRHKKLLVEIISLPKS